MKIVILAGGLGTRISEETGIKPKPMVEIGGKPILWHIMKIYSHYGYNDFVVCLGYKGYYIKEYFDHYFVHESDVTFDFRNNNKKIFHSNHAEPWKVTLVDTGLNTMTGGRIKRIREHVCNDTFMLTYGDGVADLNIAELVEFHKKNKLHATLTSVIPQGRFGALNFDTNSRVSSFCEKPSGDGHWINAGFFILEPEIFNYINGDDTVWERGPLENLSLEKQIGAYKHTGFWRPMDTLKDKNDLQGMWDNNTAPWKLWNN